MGKLTSFSRKSSSKNCIIVKRVFFFPTSYFLRKHGTEILLLFLIKCISVVPNSFKSFAFGTVVHKNVIALADVFPISYQWKDFCIASLSSVHFHPWHPYNAIQ